MMSSRTVVTVATLFTVFQGPPRIACAQATPPEIAAPPASEPEGYREAIDQAVKEFELKNFEESRALFTRAHAVWPNARTLRGLGMVEFELRNYGMSVKHLEEALSSGVKPLEGELRAETEKLLDRARGFIARVVLDVKPEVRTVLIDGVPIDMGEDGTITLQVGDHTIEVQAEKFRPEMRRLTVRGGDDQRLVIVLKQELSPQREEESRPLYKSPWLWTAIGAAVAGAAVGAAFLFRPEGKEHVTPVTTPNTPDGAGLQGLVAW